MTMSSMSSKVSPEGRVVIPAEVRRAMGIKPGESVYFKFTPLERRLEILVVEHMVNEMWANAPEPDGSDVAAMVREGRTSDARMESQRHVEGGGDSALEALPEVLRELGLQ